MGRRRGELTPPRAARRLEVDERTVRRWIRDALDGRSSRISAESVRVDVVGRYFIKKDEVARLLTQAVPTPP